MAKNYVIGENKCLIPSYDAEEIEKISGYFVGEWSDGNPNGEDRTGRFVTSASSGNNVKLADASDYISGISEAYEGDTTKCKVNPIGITTVQDDGTLSVGDKCMPSTNGIAVKSSNSLGYRVVSRVDSTHVQIIASPNNDMIQRIKVDNDAQDKKINNNIIAISQEESNRKNADNTLNTKITNEVSNRTTQYNELKTEVEQKVSKEISDRTTQYNTLQSRMDTLTSLAEGSTTGDAELADIRVGYDGTTYENAGTAVRSQVSELNSDLVSYKNGEEKNYLPETYLANSAFYADGSFNSNADGYCITEYIKVNDGDIIISRSGLSVFDRIVYYDYNKTILSNEQFPCVNIAPENCVYIRLQTRMTDYFNSVININPVKVEVSHDYELRYILDTHFRNFNGRKITVIIKDGIYDIASLFTTDEINSAEYSETGFVGLNVGDGITLRGSDKTRVIINCDIPTSYERTKRDQISTLNIRGGCTLENITVTSENIRYPVHDDFLGCTDKIRNMINCDFINYVKADGSLNGMGYGLGTRSGSVINFTNCLISPNFIYHNNANFKNKSIVNMFNCNIEKVLNIWDFESGVDCLLNLFGVTYESLSHTLNGDHEKRIKMNDYVHGVNYEEKEILDLFKDKTITFNDDGSITWTN